MKAVNSSAGLLCIVKQVAEMARVSCSFKQYRPTVRFDKRTAIRQ